MTLALTFATPLLLIGLAAAAIPFVLHMLSSVRAAEQLFPTLRFLRVSMEKTARRRKIQHWLLLVLRAALLGVLAMAVAEPISRATGGWDGGKRYAAVLILDNSLSMTAGGDPASRFAKAALAAAELLAGDDEPASAALIITDGSFVSEDMTANLEPLRTALEKAGTCFGVAGITGQISAAAELLENQSLARKSIYVFSDLQAISFERLGGAEALAGAKDIHLFVINTAAAPGDNVSVSDLQVTGQRVVNSQLTFTATLTNSSSTPARVKVAFHADSDAMPVPQPMLKLIPAGQNAAVQFVCAFSRPGAVTGEVRIDGDDDLPADDVRHFAIRIGGRVGAVVVRGPAGADETPDADPSLMTTVALDPYNDPSAQWPIELHQRSAIHCRDLSAGTLRDADALFLCNVDSFTDSQAEAIAAFAAGGGTVVFFAGPDVRAENYNRRFIDNAAVASIRSAGGLLPARLLEAVGQVGPNAPAIAIDLVDLGHPYFEGLFENMGDYLCVLVQRYYRLSPTPHGGRVLMRLANGETLVISRQFGRGQVVLCATGSSGRWSNLLSDGAKLFVPMVVRAAMGARAEPRAGTAYLAGAEVVIHPGDRPDGDGKPGGGLAVHVTGPGDEGPAHTIQARQSDEGYVAVFGATSRPGVYRWEAPGAQLDGKVAGGAFAICGDGREGLLEAIQPDALARSFGEVGLEHVYVADSLADASRLAAAVAQGRNWWDRILAVAILLLVAETVVANRFHRTDRYRRIPSAASP